MVTQHAHITLYLLHQSDLALLGKEEEAIWGLEVVDVLHHLRPVVSHLSLHCGSLEVVDSVGHTCPLQLGEGVFHHEEVDLGDTSNLDGEDAVGPSQQTLLIVSNVIEVIGEEV